MKAPLPAVLLALTLLACKTTGGGEFGEPDYGPDAEDNLRKGEAELASKNYLEAQKFFEHVRNKYPFLDAAKTAELRLADTEFERERYLEARDAYANFVKIHPTHPKVDYAAYRAALTHFKDIPSDWFFLPPSIEKDQTEIRAAMRAMGDFLRQYPSSSFVPEARKILDDTRHRAAEHEIYVASFYRRRDRWAAVAFRLQYVVDNYSGAGFDEEALFGLHEAYEKLKEPDKAKEALRTIMTRFPNTPAARKAQRLLGS